MQYLLLLGPLRRLLRPLLGFVKLSSRMQLCVLTQNRLHGNRLHGNADTSCTDQTHAQHVENTIVLTANCIVKQFGEHLGAGCQRKLATELGLYHIRHLSDPRLSQDLKSQPAAWCCTCSVPEQLAHSKNTSGISCRHPKPALSLHAGQQHRS
jgi:hypothetical protein